MFISGQLNASDDEFLDAIEVEIEKVGVRHQSAEEAATVEDKTASDDPKSSQSPGSQLVDSNERELFEKILDEEYHGSYVFYKKLPERSQEEIVQEYKRGTPFKILRRKIIDRFMHR